MWICIMLHIPSQGNKSCTFNILKLRWTFLKAKTRAAAGNALLYLVHWTRQICMCITLTCSALLQWNWPPSAIWLLSLLVITANKARHETMRLPSKPPLSRTTSVCVAPGSSHLHSRCSHGSRWLQVHSTTVAQYLTGLPLPLPDFIDPQ